MPARLPALLAAPPAGTTPLWLTNARLLDGTGAAPREHASVLVRDGRIEAVSSADDRPADATIRRDRVWLVLQLGEAVAGSALEAAPY